MPLDNEIFLDPSLQDPKPDPTAERWSGHQTSTASATVPTAIISPTWATAARSTTRGIIPTSPYINYPVPLVRDPSRTISFGDSRGGNVGHGGHSMTLDPPHERVQPPDAYSTSTAAWGSPSPSLMAGFDPYGPDETGTDIGIYFSPAEERHNGRANVIFLDGHTESHTLQELGYVVAPYTYTYTPNRRHDHARRTRTTTNVAWPQYLQNSTVNPTPGTLPFGTRPAPTSATITNVSDNHLWTGSGRDEALSQYFGTQ